MGRMGLRKCKLPEKRQREQVDAESAQKRDRGDRKWEKKKKPGVQNRPAHRKEGLFLKPKYGTLPIPATTLPFIKIKFGNRYF